MWTIVPAMVAVLMVFPVSGVCAQGKVYTWTDARGNVHITDTEPPAQARVTDVVEDRPRLHRCRAAAARA